MSAVEQDVVALTQDLVRIDTLNPPGNDNGCFDRIRQILDRNRFKTTVHSFNKGPANLIAILGDDPGQPTLCLSGHMDTVPLGDAAWSRDPFGAEIVDGRLYGRGSTDMKGGLAALLTAACSVSKKYTGRGRIVFIITAGEETGCEGSQALIRGDLPKADALIIAEPTNNRPVIGHKGMTWFKAVLNGVTAHGSMPELGENAAYKAADLLLKLKDTKFPTKHEDLGVTTLNVGEVHAGRNINSVPDRAEVSIDIRTVPGVDHGLLQKTIQKGMSDKDQLETILSFGPMLSNPKSQWIADVCTTASAITRKNLAPAFAGFFTDAGVLKPALGHPDTIIIGPGEPSVAHKTDEYCSVENILLAEKMFQNIIAKWCHSDT